MPKRRTIASIAALLAVATAIALPIVHAQDARKQVAERDVGGDHFAAGCPVRISANVAGDAFLAGCSVDIDAPVGGDAFVAGGSVRIDDAVGETLFAAGGQLRVNGTVGRNARIAGGQVELGPKSSIGGNVTVAGGDVRLNGTVKGVVRAAGGSVRIDGPVDGDVVATSGNVVLGPNARIAGQLRYASRAEITRDPAAQVQGGVERMQFDGRQQGPGAAERSTAQRGGWAWTAGLMLVAAVLVAALPDFYRRVADTLRTRPAMSLLLGFIALVCIPIAALILLFTIIGAPLALAAVALYLALLLVGYVSTGIGVGEWALRSFAQARTAQRVWRIGAAVLGVLVVSMLGRLPYVGTVVVFLALLIGLGALVLQARKTPAAS